MPPMMRWLARLGGSGGSSPPPSPTNTVSAPFSPNNVDEVSLRGWSLDEGESSWVVFGCVGCVVIFLGGLGLTRGEHVWQVVVFGGGLRLSVRIYLGGPGLTALLHSASLDGLLRLRPVAVGAHVRAALDAGGEVPRQGRARCGARGHLR